MPTSTNIHKFVGWVVGVLLGFAIDYLAGHGINVSISPEVQGAITLGIALWVSSVVAKRTNPTGANQSDARAALESVAAEKMTTAEFRAQKYTRVD